MAKKILVAFGTRFGNTKEISEKIAEILKQKEFEIQLVNLKEQKMKNWPAVEDFDGIILGSSLIVAKWKKQAKKFLRINKDSLNSEKNKLGVFITGVNTLFDHNAQMEDNIKKSIIDVMGLKIDLYNAFGPVMDFSDKSNLGKTSKAILKGVGKGLAEEKGIEIDFNGYNDLRDWDKIKEFAEKFAELL